MTFYQVCGQGEGGPGKEIAQEFQLHCLTLQCPEIGNFLNVFQSGNPFPQITNKLVLKNTAKFKLQNLPV